MMGNINYETQPGSTFAKLMSELDSEAMKSWLKLPEAKSALKDDPLGSLIISYMNSNCQTEKEKEKLNKEIKNVFCKKAGKDCTTKFLRDDWTYWGFSALPYFKCSLDLKKGKYVTEWRVRTQGKDKDKNIHDYCLAQSESPNIKEALEGLTADTRGYAIKPYKNIERFLHTLRSGGITIVNYPNEPNCSRISLLNLAERDRMDVIGHNNYVIEHAMEDEKTNIFGKPVKQAGPKETDNQLLEGLEWAAEYYVTKMDRDLKDYDKRLKEENRKERKTMKARMR